MRHYWIIALFMLSGPAYAESTDYECGAGPIIIDDWDIKRIDADIRQVWVSIRSTAAKDIARTIVSVEFFDQKGIDIGSILFLNVPIQAGGSVMKTETAVRSFGRLLDLRRDQTEVRVCTAHAIFADGTRENYEGKSISNPTKSK